MTLYQKLEKVSSEEDVKDIYIKALGLKQYQKNLIDIQTKEIWFEAKDNSKISTYAMFTQLMHYVQDALNKGDYVPPFLCVIDTKKAAIMKSADVLPFLEKKTIKWGKSASQYTQDALDAISAHIGTHFVSFKIETHEDEFISTIKNAIAKGDIIFYSRNKLVFVGFYLKRHKVRTNVCRDSIECFLCILACRFSPFDGFLFKKRQHIGTFHDGGFLGVYHT